MSTGHLLLLVDDDVDIRESLSTFLTDEGYDVVAVENGRQALDWLDANGAPCLILLDLMMPVMDGWEVLRRLDAAPSLAKIPVVVISAGSRDPVPAKEFIQKPLKIEQLLNAVQRHC